MQRFVLAPRGEDGTLLGFRPPPPDAAQTAGLWHTYRRRGLPHWHAAEKIAALKVQHREAASAVRR